MSNDGRTGEPPEGAGPWSEVRQVYMSERDVRRYREVAGLEPDDAFMWWEKYVFPGEAARLIAMGVGPDEAREVIRREQAQRDAVHRRESERRAEEARERAEREQEAAARREEEEQRRIESLRRRFETDDGVAIIVKSSPVGWYRLRRSADSHWHLERFDPDAHELVAHCPDALTGIEHLAEHLQGEGHTAESATVVDEDALASPLRLLQPLRPVVSAEFTLDGRRVSVAAAISLRRMLAPNKPDAWPGRRTVADGVSAVGDLYLIDRGDGAPIPLGFFESDTAARAHPGWPTAAKKPNSQTQPRSHH